MYCVSKWKMLRFYSVKMLDCGEAKFIVGLIPEPNRAFLYEVCVFYPCLHSFPPIKTCTIARMNQRGFVSEIVGERIE